MLAFCIAQILKQWCYCTSLVFVIQSSWRTGFKTCQDCAGRKEGRKETSEYMLYYPIKGFLHLLCIVSPSDIAVPHPEQHPFVWHAAEVDLSCERSSSGVMMEEALAGPHLPSFCLEGAAAEFCRSIWCGRDQSSCSEDWWQMWANLLFPLRLRASHQSRQLHASKHQKKKKNNFKKTSCRINVLWFDSGLKSISLGSTSFRCVSVLLLVCRDAFLPADSLSLFLSLYLPPILLSVHLHLAVSLYVSFTSPHRTELSLSLSLFHSLALHQKCRWAGTSQWLSWVLIFLHLFNNSLSIQLSLSLGFRQRKRSGVDWLTRFSLRVHSTHFLSSPCACVHVSDGSFGNVALS